MAKYRKRPIVVDAERFYVVDGKSTVPVVHLWPDERGMTPRDMTSGFIATLEGRMHVMQGDYIITGVNGEHYPCKPDIFAKTYELVNLEATF